MPRKAITPKASTRAVTPRKNIAPVQHRPLKWTDAQQSILRLILAGRLSQAKVAANVGVSLRVVERLVAHPDFVAKLAEARANLEEAVKGVLYADKARRVVALSEMAESARQEYEARPWLKEVRPTRDGDVTNESYNADAHAAFRGALDDIAKELGHRRPSAVDDAKQGNLQVVFMLPPQGATPDGARTVTTTVEADAAPATPPTIAIEFPPLDNE